MWSDALKLTVYSSKPQPVLTVSPLWLSRGDSVTLKCKVEHPSAGWRFYWYKSVPKPQKGIYIRRQINGTTTGTVQDSYIIHGPAYTAAFRCKAGRGNPEHYTLHSGRKFVWSRVINGAVVTLQPNWPKIYSGEMITLTCEIKNGGDTEWEYTSTCPHCVSIVAESCGDSVTLKCKVEHPSAGWRFYWYKSVPKPQKGIYIRRQINGTTNGTVQDSYIIHGPAYTAAFRCKAGRGNPEHYTLHSGRKFVWSRDFNSAASLKLIPNKAQYVVSEHVALSCQGNSTEWRVMRFTEREPITHCSGWGKMIGSTCDIHRLTYTDGVYWCESGTGEFSNAVNITVHRMFHDTFL
ncbi:hypothetical protein L3Q82_016770 [Scortum barcoo]|uniref:Uncharacterized protein n=1 Tax=Scortum barcoo TaxID=214431 RepID=A0ACB8X894_9TELE|nr:hypothetical protein L3Q82_016770 [Scortum barcoo]